MSGISIKTVLVTVLALGIAAPALATTTDWISGRDFSTIKRAVGNKLLTKIECRDTGKKGGQVADYEYRVTYVNNPGKIRYRWAIGNQYGPYRARAKKDGYKQVSYSSFRRKTSGLKVHCAVWHKKP